MADGVQTNPSQLPNTGGAFSGAGTPAQTPVQPSPAQPTQPAPTTPTPAPLEQNVNNNGQNLFLLPNGTYTPINPAYVIGQPQPGAGYNNSVGQGSQPIGGIMGVSGYNTALPPSVYNTPPQKIQPMQEPAGQQSGEDKLNEINPANATTYGDQEGYKQYNDMLQLAMKNGKSFQEAQAFANTQVPNSRPYQIATNLMQGYQNNPALFANRQTFEQAYNYHNRPPEEQALLDKFYNQTQEHQASQPIQQPQVPVQQQVQQYQMQQMSGMTPQQLNSYVQSGSISETDPTFTNLMATNPQLSQQYQQVKQATNSIENINQTHASSFNAIQGVNNFQTGKSWASQANSYDPSQNPALQAIMALIPAQTATIEKLNSINPQYGQQYKDLMMAPDMLQMQQDLVNATKQRASLQRDSANLAINAKMDTQGTETSQSYVRAKVYQDGQIISSKIFDLNQTIDANSQMLSYRTQLAQGQIDSQMKQDQMNQGLVQSQMQGLSQIGDILGQSAQMTNQYGMQQNEFQQQTGLERLKTAMANPSLTSQDPQVRQLALQQGVQTIYDQYSPLGFSRAPQQIVSDIQQGVASGKYSSEAEGLQDLMKNVQSKTGFQEYQQGLALKGIGATVRINPLTGMPYSTRDYMSLLQPDSDQNNQQSQPSTPGNYNVSPGNTQNRPDRNNNPGDVKLASGQDISQVPGATGVDDLGHIIFKTPTDGYNWMVHDLTAKVSGNNTHGLGPDSTLADLAKVYAEGPDWGKNVANSSGYSLDTKLGSIDMDKLAPAVARAEGFTGTVSATPSQQSQTQQNEQSDSNIDALQPFYTKTPSVKERFALAQSLGVSTDDVNKMIQDYRNNPTLNTTQKNLAQGVIDGDTAYATIKKQDPNGVILANIEKQAQANNIPWTESDYKNENSTKLAFTTGKYGQQITAAATAGDHLSLLYQAAQYEKNGNIPKFNEIMNNLKRGVGLDTTAGVDVLSSKLGDELAAAYGGGALGDRAKETVNANSFSPQYLNTFVSTTATALADKMKELNNLQWKPLMKTDNPQIQGVLDKFKGISQSTGKVGQTGNNTTQVKTSNGISLSIPTNSNY